MVSLKGVAYHYCEYAYGRAVGEKILGYIMPVYADQQGPVELAMVYGRTAFVQENQ